VLRIRNTVHHVLFFERSSSISSSMYSTHLSGRGFMRALMRSTAPGITLRSTSAFGVRDKPFDYYLNDIK
jgi:hypothetical protein